MYCLSVSEAVSVSERPAVAESAAVSPVQPAQLQVPAAVPKVLPQLMPFSLLQLFIL